MTWEGHKALDQKVLGSKVLGSKPPNQHRVLGKKVLDKTEDQQALVHKVLEQQVLDQVIAKLHIHTLEDWYLVPKSHIQLVEGSFKLLKKYFLLKFVFFFFKKLF